MKKIIINVALILSGGCLLAQSEMSAFTSTGRAGAATTFVTDYQAIGINPANLGYISKFDDKHISLGLLEMSYSVYSEALTKPELRESIFKFDSEDFTYEEKVQAGINFTQSALAMNIDLLPIGFAVQTKKAWGLAFGIKERMQWYSKLNQTTAEILFQGYNAPYFDLKYDSLNNPLDTGYIADLVAMGAASVPQKLSKIMDGSHLSLSWYREYNFSFGMRLIEQENLSLFTGFGLKYLSGMAIMDIQAENGKLDAYSAVTPFLNADYGKAATINPSTITQDGGLPKSAGSGFGFDIGMTAVIKEVLKIGIAVNDIGSITWDGNVYASDDGVLDTMLSGGFNSYNMIQGAQDVIGKGGIFSWKGLAEKKVKLPTVIRVGVGVEIADGWELGVDAVLPTNETAGNYEKGIYALGLDFTPISWIRLSTGVVAGGNYGFNLPVGVTLTVGANGTWELGVASRDAVTFFTKNRPTLSMSTGFMRFRF